MITIEQFFKPKDHHQYLRFTYDDPDDLFLLDSLLADRFEIIEQNMNNIIVERVYNAKNR